MSWHQLKACTADIAWFLHGIRILLFAGAFEAAAAWGGEATAPVHSHHSQSHSAAPHQPAAPSPCVRLGTHHSVPPSVRLEGPDGDATTLAQGSTMLS